MNDESRKWELFKAWQGLVARFPVFQECTYSKFQAVVEQFANAWRPFAIRSQMVRVFVAERSSARGNRSEGSAGEGGGDDDDSDGNAGLCGEADGLQSLADQVCRGEITPPTRSQSPPSNKLSFVRTAPSVHQQVFNVQIQQSSSLRPVDSRPPIDATQAISADGMLVAKRATPLSVADLLSPAPAPAFNMPMPSMQMAQSGSKRPACKSWGKHNNESVAKARNKFTGANTVYDPLAELLHAALTQ